MNHRRRHVDRRQQAAFARFSRPRDIKCCAVIDRGAEMGQAELT
jgi:hypothetical protein